jgi:hypothetical protein
MFKKDIVKRPPTITEVDLLNLVSSPTLTFLNQDCDELMRLIKKHGIQQHPVDYNNIGSA